MRIPTSRDVTLAAALFGAAIFFDAHAAQPQPRQPFTAAEEATLRELGKQYRQYQHMHRRLENRFQAERQKILADGSLTKSQRQAKVAKLVDDLMETSNMMVERKRQPVIDKLKQIANNTVAKHANRTGKQIAASEGTAVGAKGFRGNWGDIDAEAGEQVVRQLRDAAKVMGLDDADFDGAVKIGKGKTTVVNTPEGRIIKETPAYVSIEGDLNLTVHKKGPKLGRVGSTAHQMQIEVNARLPETYVAIEMRNKQIGQTEVYTHDHMKKASKGLKLTPNELIDGAHAEKLQSFAKGTMKAIETARLTDPQIKDILKNSGYDEHCTPQTFRKQLTKLKEGYNLAPEAAGLDQTNAAKFQEAVRQTLQKCDRTSARSFENKVANRQKRLDGLLAQAKTLEASGDAPKAKRIRDLVSARKAELIDSKLRYDAARKVNMEAMGEDVNFKPTMAKPRPKAGHSKKGPTLTQKVKAYTGKIKEHAGRFMRGPTPDPELVSSKFWDKSGQVAQKGMKAYFRYMAAKRLLESESMTEEGAKMAIEAIPGYWVGKKYRDGESGLEVLKELARELCPKAMLVEMAVGKSAEMMKESFNNFKQDQFVRGLYNRASMRVGPDGKVEIESFGGLPKDMVFHPAFRVGTINGAQAREQVVDLLKQADPELRYYRSEMAQLQAKNGKLSKQESKGDLSDAKLQAIRRERLENTRAIKQLGKLYGYRDVKFGRDEKFAAEQLNRMLEQQYRADQETFQAVQNIANRDKGYETDALKGLSKSDWMDGRGQDLYRRAEERYGERLARATGAERQQLEAQKDQLIFDSFRKSMESSDHGEGKKVYMARVRMDRLEEKAAAEAKQLYRRTGLEDSTDATNDRYLDFKIALSSAYVKQAALGDSADGRGKYRETREYQNLTAMHGQLKRAAIEAKQQKAEAEAKAKDLAKRWCEKHGIPTGNEMMIEMLAGDYLHKKQTGNGAYLKNSMKCVWEEYRAERAEKALKDGDMDKAMDILKAGQKGDPSSPVWAKLMAATQGGNWPSKSEMAQLVRHVPEAKAVGAENVVGAEMAMEAGDRETAMAIVDAALNADPADLVWQGLKKAMELWDGTVPADGDLETLVAMMTGSKPAPTTGDQEDIAAILSKHFGIPGGKPVTDLSQIGANFGPAKPKTGTVGRQRTTPGTARAGQFAGVRTGDVADKVEVSEEIVEYVQATIPAGASKREHRLRDGGRRETYNVQGQPVCERRWYPNGNMALEEYYVPRTDPRYRYGLKHGRRRQWSKNGKLMKETGYNYGVKHGRDKSWLESGNPRFEIMLKGGKANGWVKQWNADGTLLRDQFMKGGKPHGPERYYHRNGKMSREQYYLAGKKHGLYQQWTETGQIVEEARFKDDKRHGLQRNWDPDTGAPLSEMTCVDGAGHGVGRSWGVSQHGPSYNCRLRGKYVKEAVYNAARAKDPTLPPLPTPPQEDLSMEAVESYKISGTEYKKKRQNGSQEAAYFAGEFNMVGCRGWYPNGQMEFETPVKNHYRHGTSRSWDEKGRLRSFETFKYGKPYGLMKVVHHRTAIVTEEARVKDGWYEGEGKEYDWQTGKLRREFGCTAGEMYFEKQFDRTTGKLVSHTEWDLEKGKASPPAKKGGCFASHSTRPRSGKKYDATTGKMTLESHYDENGKQAGIWKHFSADGTPEKEQEYGDSYRLKMFTKDGTPEREESRKTFGTMGVLHGPRRYWAKDGDHKGKLTSEENYQQGKLHGPRKTWSARTGKLTADETYVNGNKDGLCKRFYDDGKPIEEAAYVEGKMEGDVKTYWHNGRIKSEGTYRNGGREGWFKEYRFAGGLDRKVHYREGKTHGPRIDYNEDGSVKRVFYWLNGGHAGEKGYREALKKDPSLPAMMEGR